MKREITAIISGVLFAFGLGIAGMLKPENIIGFLDFGGDWRPDLLLVMIGAIVPQIFFYRIVRTRKTPLFDSRWFIPMKTEISINLIVGAAIFGIGWGLSGFCPGPSLVNLANLDLEAATFVVFMVLGMFSFRGAHQFVSMTRRN